MKRGKQTSTTLRNLNLIMFLPEDNRSRTEKRVCVDGRSVLVSKIRFSCKFRSCQEQLFTRVEKGHK